MVSVACRSTESLGSMSKRRDLIRSASKWQAEQLDTLSSHAFSELSALPRRAKLEAPSHLNGLRFVIDRRPGENGGVEISVRRVWRHLLIFEGSVGPSFEKLADGRVIYPDTTVEDEE